MGYRSFHMNMETKKQIFDRYKEEYFKAKSLKQGGKKTLTKILDTLCEVTGMARKSVIRKLNRIQKKDPTSEEGRGRSLYYTADVTAALKEIWDAGGEVCGELLHPIITEYAQGLAQLKAGSIYTYAVRGEDMLQTK